MSDSVAYDGTSSLLSYIYDAQLNMNRGRFCSFSPCIEQVQRTCLALQDHGFQEISTMEVLQTEIKITRRTIPVRDLSFLKQKIRNVNNSHESTYALLLEKVQKAFLRFLYKKLFGYYPFLYPTKFLLGMLKEGCMLEVRRNYYYGCTLEVRRNYSLIISACSTLRGQSDCPELVAQVVRLFVPAVLKHQLRPRKHPLLAVPAARTVAHANSPLVRALTMINALLTSAPECDLFAARWKDVCRECLRFCEKMDG
ncbi:hypothetical protein SFRURICE_007934 [Spodoptera frugiperda]|nr:hypothetical protein SFRURICE_007934 [Spodoptera frugiperda]